MILYLLSWTESNSIYFFLEKHKNCSFFCFLQFFQRMILIGIAGKKGSGKDSVADYLCAQYRFQKRAFADPLKQICQILFQLEDQQLSDPILKETIDDRWQLSPRQMFQKIGTDLFRNHYDPHIWLDHFKSWYFQHALETHIVCNDVRFQNECDLIHELGGIVIRLTRTLHTTPDSHPSESVESLTNIDLEWNNNGSLSDLYQTIETWIPSIL